MKFHAGYVSILGRPNAGKSTLLNALLGEKVAIVARRPQTTRTTIQGVLNTASAQVVFIDTPGIHKSDTLFNKRMMETVRGAADERDLLLYLVDATQKPEEEDAHAISLVAKVGTPAFLVLNKLDLLDNKNAVLERIEQYKTLHEFDEYYPISAVKKDGLDELTRGIVARLPESEAFFPPDHITDQPARFMVGELVREKALLYTSQEVPHAVAVLVEKWEEKKGITRILASIYVERDGQKRIIIGKGGAVLKKIGTAARIEAEKLLGTKVYLELFVKVRKNWREDPQFLNEIDWRSMSGE